MATKIRLKRIGRRNSPFYRMVTMDSRKRRDGAAIEQLGWYNPIDTNHSYDLNEDRILYWLKEGALPTKAVKKIMRRSGLSYRWHLMQQGKDDSEIEKEMKKWDLERENVLKNRAEKVALSKEKKREAKENDEQDAGIEKIAKNESDADITNVDNHEDGISNKSDADSASEEE